MKNRADNDLMRDFVDFVETSPVLPGQALDDAIRERIGADRRRSVRQTRLPFLSDSAGDLLPAVQWSGILSARTPVRQLRLRTQCQVLDAGRVAPARAANGQLPDPAAVDGVSH